MKNFSSSKKVQVTASRSANVKYGFKTDLYHSIIDPSSWYNSVEAEAKKYKKNGEYEDMIGQTMLTSNEYKLRLQEEERANVMLFPDIVSPMDGLTEMMNNLLNTEAEAELRSKALKKFNLKTSEVISLI